MVDRTCPDRVNVVVVLDRGRRVVPVCVEVRDGLDGWRVTSLGVPDDHRPDPLAPDRPDWEHPDSAEPW